MAQTLHWNNQTNELFVMCDENGKLTPEEKYRKDLLDYLKSCVGRPIKPGEYIVVDIANGRIQKTQ